MIEAREIMEKTGYASPHTVHCGPDGVYLNALGAVDEQGPDDGRSGTRRGHLRALTTD